MTERIQKGMDRLTRLEKLLKDKEEEKKWWNLCRNMYSYIS